MFDADNDITSRRKFLTGLTATGVNVLACRSVFGKSKDTENEEGFVPLFNGKDLRGWHTNVRKTAHGSGGSWKVEDGAITGEQDPPGSGNGAF